MKSGEWNWSNVYEVSTLPNLGDSTPLVQGSKITEAQWRPGSPGTISNLVGLGIFWGAMRGIIIASPCAYS